MQNMQVFQLKYVCPKLKFLDVLILEIIKNKNFEFIFFVFDSCSYLNQYSHRLKSSFDQKHREMILFFLLVVFYINNSM